MHTLAAEFENDTLFNGLAWSFAISGFLLLIVAFIGGKNSVGKRVFFGILGLVLVGVGMLCLSGVWNEIWIGGGKSTLCILFGPWAALIWGIVGIFKAGDSGDKRDVPAPTAQQWNQQNPGAQQWGAPGQPQQWGQPPAQPQGYGHQPPAQPQQPAPEYGYQPPAQPQPPQQWGQQQPGHQQWGQQPPQQYPPQYPPQA